jgi:hypothetical protein
MIFYLARNAEGKRILETTQVKAKAVSKDFQQIDVPVDKEGLRGALQELISEADCGPDNDPDYAVGDTIPVRLQETDDGLDLDLVPEHKLSAMTKDMLANQRDHDARCVKCHVILTATEEGAKKLAQGQDMTALTEWIDHMPDWVITQIEAAISERKAALAD